MKTLTLALATAMLLSTTAWAGDAPDECSTRMLAGRWMFATDVGKQTFFPGGDITAIGTFRVDRAGNLKGKFDATVANFGFLPGVEFDGTVTVNPDCTGTLTFTTSRRHLPHGQHRRAFGRTRSRHVAGRRVPVDL